MAVANQVKTVFFLGLLTGLLMWIGSFWGSSGLAIALILSIAMNFGSYWFSDRIVLAVYKAKQVDEKKAPRLYRIVKELAKGSGLPMPKVYIVPSRHPNAFATGRSPKHGAVAATEGILDLLDDEELKGVMAHELAHIRNRDTLIQSISATIAGVISYVAFMARWAAIFGGFGRNDDEGGGSMLEFLVLAILTPILATIIQLAISRSREYLADASAAKSLKDGNGLASALEKLDTDIRRKPLAPGSLTETTAHLFISNPFGRAKGLLSLFSTHPAPHDRIRRLRQMRF